MPMTEPLRAAVLGKTSVAIDFPTPTGWEVALFFGEDGLEAGSPTEEITNDGYARLPVVWDGPFEDQVSNRNELEWLPLEAWQPVRFVGVYETDGGTLQYFGPLSQPIAPVPPLVLRIAEGNLVIALDTDPPELFDTFIELLDTPTTYAGSANAVVAVTAAEDGVEFVDAATLPVTPHAGTHELGGDDELTLDWTQLANVPPNFTPSSHAPSHQLGGADELVIDWTQLTNVPSFVATFLDLTDTPPTYAGFAGSVVRVNQLEDGLEYIDGVVGDLMVHDGADWKPFNVGADGTTLIADSGEAAGIRWGIFTPAAIPFTNLIDTPPDYVGGAGQYVRVSQAEDGLVFDTVVTPQQNIVYGTGWTSGFAYVFATLVWNVFPIQNTASEFPATVVQPLQNRIQVPVDGVYAVTFAAHCEFAQSGTIQIAPFVNGVEASEYTMEFEITQQQDMFTATITAYVPLDADDFIDIRGQSLGPAENVILQEYHLSVARLFDLPAP